jgi:hypothetical protein
MNFVELFELSSVVSENPSDASCFCNRANTISDTVAAKSPVAQSIRIAIIKGKIKKSDLPSVVSRNSRDFRGAISTKEPNTTRATTDKIVKGECKTECVFVTQDNTLKSISSRTPGFGELAPFLALLGFGEASLALGEALLGFGDEALLGFGEAPLAFGELAGLEYILLEPQSF